MSNHSKDQTQELSLDVNLDTTPVLYTDSIIMNVNDDGIVLDVAQKVSTSNRMRIVSRIGMSRSHAKKFLAELGKLIATTEKSGKRGD